MNNIGYNKVFGLHICIQVKYCPKALNQQYLQYPSAIGVKVGKTEHQQAAMMHMYIDRLRLFVDL